MAADGFWVFPCLPWPLGTPKSEGKTPAVKFKAWATRDPEAIRGWWSSGQRNSTAFGAYDAADCNIGVYTGRFGDDAALVVIDEDNKGEKRGGDELFKLELEGCDIPDTLVVDTPSGGKHHYHHVPEALRQGVDVLAKGLDIRSRGGFVLAPGSTLDGQPYRVLRNQPVAPAPEWLTNRCGRPADRASQQPPAQPIQVDVGRAVSRATEYLRTDAPVAVKGGGGDQTTYKVAARCKDFGVSADEAVALMFEFWNPRCPPGWSFDRLQTKVRNAYAYGLETPGAAAPEAQFTAVEPDPTPPLDSVEHPFDELNKHHAFVLAGGGAHILWETTDATGRFDLQHLTLGAYHSKHAPFTMTVGKKTSPITEEWMRWKGRRGYDGLVFRPEQPAPERFYNLWRGFAVEPWPTGETPPAEAEKSFRRFLDHLAENICRGDAALSEWLLCWFAQLIQRPWEKPSVALVLKGEKGVGKNIAVERIGDLLANHFLLTSNRRYLIGNFNGHLENCLLFVLDEAFWSGDKQAEGVLKDLITGTSHQIEHKGKEPYSVDNRTRLVILGNEEWVVPASHDERRYGVLEPGTARKQDREYFAPIGKEGWSVAASRLLLAHLKALPITRDVSQPPKTDALLDQKHSSLPPLHQWWHTCLEEGRISYSDFGEDWPDTISRQRLRDAFGRYAKGRGVNRYLPDEREFGKLLRKPCPALGEGRSRKDGYTYKLPVLAAARAAWDAFMGQSAAAWGTE